MEDPTTLRNELESKSNFSRLESMCELLKKKESPSVHQFTNLIGMENRAIRKENRGSKFLIPYDKRFNWACINPDLENADNNTLIDGLAFGGEQFEIKMSDLLNKFSEYKIIVVYGTDEKVNAVEALRQKFNARKSKSSK